MRQTLWTGWHKRNKRECHHVCNANTCINNNNIANRDISRPGFRKHRSNIDIHTRVACHYHLRFISTLNFVFILRDRLNLRLADPKVDDFSVYHSIRSSEVDMLCRPWHWLCARWLACLFETVGPVRATTIYFPLDRGASVVFFFLVLRMPLLFLLGIGKTRKATLIRTYFSLYIGLMYKKVQLHAWISVKS